MEKSNSQLSAAEANRTRVSSPASSIFHPPRIALAHSAACVTHSGQPPDFMCTACGVAFCQECVKVYGHKSGGVCPRCGSLCLPFAEVKRKLLLLAEQQSPFGAKDFFIALAYPLRDPVAFFPIAMLTGACLWSLPMLALSSFARHLALIGVLPAAIANTILIGSAAAAVQGVEDGRLDTRNVFDLSAILAEFIDLFVLGGFVVFMTGWPWLFVLAFGGHSWLQWLSVFWSAAIYPLALAVAAKTQSSRMVVNPAAILSVLAVWRGNAARLFLMYLVILATIAGFVAWILPWVKVFGFYTPVLPVIGICAGVPLFYGNVAVACLIGRAFFKSSEREGTDLLG